MLIVADGAPGLIKAIEQRWPASDRQHCTLHRVRNLLAKLPERERERVRDAYWQALDGATSVSDAKRRLQALASELDNAGYTAAAKCLADDLDALVVHLRYPLTHHRRLRSTNLLERSLAEFERLSKVIGRFLGETQLHHAHLGSARPLPHTRQKRRPPQPTRTPTPSPNEIHRQRTTKRPGDDSRIN